MPTESISPNMSLIIPAVGATPSPTWATDLNNSLTLIDQHNHTTGYGVPIPAAGLNITSELTLNNNNLIAIKSLRMTPQSILAGPSDLDCLFVNGVDLYYNDGSGNHVRMTQSGGVAGTPGSISNLTSPASASYVAGNQTFVWQSGANTPANMDNASVILRNLSANSFGLTLNPPAAMGADFSLTLPTLPASQKIMTLDASGNISAPYTVDNVTIEIASNVIKQKNTNVVTVTTNTTTSSANAVYLVNTASGDVTITLHTAVGGGLPMTIKKISDDENQVILNTVSGQSIDLAASGEAILSAREDSITVQSNGANYKILSHYLLPIRALTALSTNQSVPNNTLTKVTVTGQSALGCSFGTNSIIILYDGYYNITGNLKYLQNAAGDRNLLIYLNGSPIMGQTINGNSNGITDNYLSASVSNVLLVEGDVLNLYTSQASSGALNLVQTQTYDNSLSISRVGLLGGV